MWSKQTSLDGCFRHVFIISLVPILVLPVVVFDGLRYKPGSVVISRGQYKIFQPLLGMIEPTD